MWDENNNYDYLNILTDSQKAYLRKTCSYFNLPSRGIVFFYDEKNYKDNKYRDIWVKNLGNHLHIKYRLEGLSNRFGCTPQEIESLIYRDEYSHMIWLSRRAWDKTHIDFVWNLSHELRHLEQDIENRMLSLAGSFILCNLKDMNIEEPKIPTTVPTEMDAELVAWRTVSEEDLFGEQGDLYVRDNANKGEKQDIFRGLKQYGRKKKYDIYTNTTDFLRKYRTQFERIIDENPTRYSSLESVDKICSELHGL